MLFLTLFFFTTKSSLDEYWRPTQQEDKKMDIRTNILYPPKSHTQTNNKTTNKQTTTTTLSPCIYNHFFGRRDYDKLSLLRETHMCIHSLSVTRHPLMLGREMVLLSIRNTEPASFFRSGIPLMASKDNKRSFHSHTSPSQCSLCAMCVCHCLMYLKIHKKKWKTTRFCFEDRRRRDIRLRVTDEVERICSFFSKHRKFFVLRARVIFVLSLHSLQNKNY